MNKNIISVEKEKIFCPKCDRKNKKEAERCVECNFPLKDEFLIKIISIEFLQEVRKRERFFERLIKLTMSSF